MPKTARVDLFLQSFKFLLTPSHLDNTSLLGWAPSVILNTMKKSPVIHFELPYKDAKRVSDFYSKVFGWDMMNLGPEMNNYILAGTTETEGMKAIKPGEINGGLFPSEEDHKHPLITISVEDIHKSMKMVKETGGKIINGPHTIQGVGEYVAFEDSEGNRTSMLQPIQ